jgi:hypothetical protein
LAFTKNRIATTNERICFIQLILGVRINLKEFDPLPKFINSKSRKPALFSELVGSNESKTYTYFDEYDGWQIKVASLRKSREMR